MPLKIDPLTLEIYRGTYARLLVDIDFSYELSERILLKMKQVERNIYVSFFSRYLIQKNYQTFVATVACLTIVRLRTRGSVFVNRLDMGRRLDEEGGKFKKIGGPSLQPVGRPQQ